MRKHKIFRKKISSKLAYQNPYFKVWEDDVARAAGKQSKYFWVQAHPAVFVVPITDSMETFLIGQHRYPVDQYGWEAVGGGTDGQDPLKAAKRELWEETGFKARRWKKVGKFCPWSGVTSEIDHIYVARDLIQTGNNKQIEDCIDQMIKVPLKAALQMIKKGKIRDSQSMAALTLAAMHLGVIKS